MATYYEDLMADLLQVGPEERNNNGGKYRKVIYNGGQFRDVQLGSGIHDLLRCPFGVEAVARNIPDKLCIKVDANDKLSKFIEALDKKVIDAVNDPTLVHRSSLRLGTVTNNIKLKLVPETQVLVTSKIDENQISALTSGTFSDIQQGSMILPIVKIHGGVYFVEDNYGTSIVATKILVVKGLSSEPIDFNLGDGVSMATN